MRPLRIALPALACLVALTGCDTQAKQQLATLAHADSLRTDSLVSIKNELLDQVMTGTQFVNDINTEMAKLKSHPLKLNTAYTSESSVDSIKAERAAVVSRIHDLVARLDASEARVASLRKRAAALSEHDSTLLAQVAAYETTIADLRQTVEQQKAEYEATIAKQNETIAALNTKVDAVTQQATALGDTVNALTAEKNTAYYVIGTKDQLVKEGILVEEGHKRFFILGGRTTEPARDLDPSKFTKIDRLRDSVITLPAGEYTIFSRQDPQYASPVQTRDGKIVGGLRIDQPERFWEPSRFLIIVKS